MSSVANSHPILLHISITNVIAMGRHDLLVYL